MRKPVVLLSLCAAALAHAAPARADSVTTCTGASSQGQTERDAHRLVEARDQFIICAKQECPNVVRKDCTTWLEQVQASLPTIVPIATDTAGNGLPDAKVSMDGKLLLEKADGRAVEVDPGTHSFTFEAADGTKTDIRIVVEEGQKERRVAVPVAREPSSGQLVVAAQQEATVTVDDRIVVQGRFDGWLPAGLHAIRVTGSGKIPYKSEVSLREGEMRTVDVTLEDEHRKVIWPWIVGGAALAVGAAVGGYFLLKPSDASAPVPPGKFGGVTFMTWRP